MQASWMSLLRNVVMKIRDKNTECLIPIVAIIIIAVLCLLNIGRLNYAAVLNDEFGYWGNAASIAGYDWKDLIAETPYYAWGYSIWLVPIIALFPGRPILWYKLAIVLNIVFLSVSYGLCCKVAKKIFPGVSLKILYAVSLIVIIYPSNIVYAQVAWSETLLYLLMWVAVWLFLKLEELFSYKLLLLEIVTLVYMYCVHARTIGVLGVGVCFLFFILLKNKKHPALYLAIIAVIGCGYFMNSCVKHIQLSQLWENSTTSQLNNVAVNSNTALSYLNLLTSNLRLFLDSLGGKLIYLLIGTGATLFISVGVVIKQLVKLKTTKYTEKSFLMTKCFCLSALIVAYGLDALQMMAWAGRKDCIVYSRYMENALGPVLLFSIIYAVVYVKDSRILLGIAAVILGIGIRSVYWRVLEADSFFNSICSPIVGGFYDASNKDVDKAFLYIILVYALFVVVLIGSTFVKKTNYRFIIIFVLFFSGYVVLGNKCNIYMNTARDGFDQFVLPIYNDISENYSDREIYYIKNADLDLYSMNPKYLQFLIANRSIHVIGWEEFEEIKDNNPVVLINSDDGEMMQFLEWEGMTLVKESSKLKMYSYE